ncbi:MAG: 3-deoxy-D-manno-octulosonic acid transferase [Planctomycetes bacterium]|nr:3-deoxy-D-manno-octulosonic acid transferase [Planctomycetota bacterium]
MRYVLDPVYLLVLLLLSPWLIYQVLTKPKYRRGLLDKLLGRAPTLPSSSRRAWFHGVSVGEIHLLRQVIAAFRQRHPDWDCVVSTTTETGLQEAQKHFADLPVFFFPLDFSWAVRRALQRVDPELIVLAEGELWPNFLMAAKDHGATVVVVNGRLSPRSAQRYRRLRRLTGPLWRRIDLFAVQTREYAEAFEAAAVPPDRIRVTESVKYDGVQTDRDHDRVASMRRLLNVGPSDRVWVCGSTQAPEEEIALDIYRRLRDEVFGLRLVLVPRQRERFEEVAGLLRRSGLPFVRRSTLNGPVADRDGVVLVDTIGELSAVWGLAEVAFVGGSLDGKRGGQNMIEPAAYGAAVVFGPHVWNFRDTATRLVESGAAVQVADAAELEREVRSLLADGERQRRLGEAARQFVLAQQGATARTMTAIDAVLKTAARKHAA